MQAFIIIHYNRFASVVPERQNGKSFTNNIYKLGIFRIIYDTVEYTHSVSSSPSANHSKAKKNIETIL